MASAGSWASDRNPPRPAWSSAASVVLLALPFVLMAVSAYAGSYLSNQHAHLIEKALLIRDRGRPELMGFVYPPLPFLATLIWSHPIVPSMVAALVGGATAWLLWRQLRLLRMPRLAAVLLLVLPMSLPTSLYLASQSLGEMLALFLLLLAWVHYLAFTQDGQTRSGFLAGMVLALAFFADHFAALYAVPFALFAPFFVRERGNGASRAAAVVVLFPVLAAIAAWSYVNWVFVGDPLHFLSDPASSVFVYARADAPAFIGGSWGQAVKATGRDLFSTPLYLASGVLVARIWPSRALAFLVPLAVVAAVRAHGMYYPDYFAISTFTVVALAALPRQMPARAWPICLLAAVLQIGMAYASSPRMQDARWGTVVLTGRVAAADEQEQAIGAYLAQYPPHSILTDDRTSYRIVARAGTARPFLLPADPGYALARSQPAAFVPYVLVPEQSPSGFAPQVAADATVRPPNGARLRAAWPGWRLYSTGPAVSLPPP